MIKRSIAAGALLALTSCGGNLAPIAAGLTASAVSPETVARLAGMCRGAAPLIGAARSMGALIPGPALAILDEVGPYCALMAAGTTPPTTDANTINWLPTNLAGLSQALALVRR